MTAKDSPKSGTAVLIAAPEGGYSATDPKTGTTSQGETIDEALTNLREAMKLYREEFPLPSVESKKRP